MDNPNVFQYLGDWVLLNFMGLTFIVCKRKVPYIHTSSTFWRFWQEAGGGRSREAASFFLKMSILAALTLNGAKQVALEI